MRDTAENQHVGSVEQMRAIMSSMTDGLIIFDMDGNVLYMNPAALGIHKYESLDQARKHLSKLSRTVSAYTLDGRPIPIDEWPLARVIRGETFRDFEMRVHRRDIDYEWIGSYSGVPVVGSDGHIAQGVLTLRDVTERKQAEEALRESERRMNLTLLASGVGTFHVDLASGVTHWNTVEYELLGLKEGDAPSNPETFFRYVHPDDAARLRARWEEATRTGTLDEEFRVIRADGQERWLAAKGQFVPATPADPGIAGGNKFPVQFLGVNFDITTRRLAEEAVRQSQQTFYELVERAPFGIYIVDSRFRIAHMNVSSQNNAFRNVRPIIGRPFTEAMHILWPDEVAEQIISLFKHTLETGEPYYSPRFTYSRHDVETVESYEWELHRMTLPDGQYGVICYYFDSTELKNATLALAISRTDAERRAEELSVLMEALPVGVFIAHDPESKRITGNRAAQELVARPPDANLSKSAPEQERPTAWQEMKDGVPIAPSDLPMQRAVLGETVRDYEMDLVFNDGTIKSVIGNASPLLDANGKPRGGIAVLMDVTQRNQLEAHKREFYRRTILAATDGKLVVCEKQEIEEMAGPALACWQLCTADDFVEATSQAKGFAISSGMEPDRAYEFLAGVVEAATNVIKHGKCGSISLHRVDDRIICVFSDSGPGIGAMALPDVALTKFYSTAGTLGMGYKVMIRFSDRVYLATGPEGTTVAVEMAIDPVSTLDTSGLSD